MRGTWSPRAAAPEDVPDSLELLVAGSIALDTRDGPFGQVKEELGGSAVYFALAASLITPVKVVAPVGVDGSVRVARAFDGRAIDTTGVAILEAPTYRWKAHQEHGRNIDLGSTDQIYDQWEPAIPEGFNGWAFVGSMRPDRQAQVVKMLSGARLVAADAMLSYVHTWSDSKDVLRRASWFFCNQEEFTALGGKEPEEFRRQWWLDGLVLKAGAAGVTAYTADGSFHAPAVKARPVIDTTGAGDALAGGMMARWVSTGAERAGLVDALAYGVACASLAIESIGTRGIGTATPKLLHARLAEVIECMRKGS